MQNGEYPLGLEAHSGGNCISLCAEYNWCLGVESELNGTPCRLITDQTLFEKGTGQKLTGKWAEKIKIDGQGYTAYCDKEGCDNIGYITFGPREGYSCQVKTELQKKNKKIAEENSEENAEENAEQAPAPSPSPK